MTTDTIQVWDRGVRIFHWSLVFFFTLSYLTGDEIETVHVYSGYTIIALLVFRIVWGFVGPQHARFSDFVRPPAAVIDYLKRLKAGNPPHYLGHNPAGGAMILALLLSLSLTTFSGLKAYAAEGHGPLASNEFSLVSPAYADHDDDDEVGEDGKKKKKDEFWAEVHEVMGNITLSLVILHILGVIVSSRLEGQNLARAMVTGEKKLPPEGR